MENLFSKYPNCGKRILDKLSNEDIAKCRKVSESWKSIVDQSKIPSVRKIKKYCRSHEEMWKKVFHNFDAKVVAEIADDVEMYYRYVNCK